MDINLLKVGKTMERRIAWEKARDPFDFDEDDVNPFPVDTYDEEGMQMPQVDASLQAMVTPMGLVPIAEHTNPYKIFNFWLGHTNFAVSEPVAVAINNTSGVEAFDVFSPYRFRIAVGKLFQARDVKMSIQKALHALPIEKSHFDEVKEED